MAYVSRRCDYWRAEVRRRGYKPIYRALDTKQQAQKWARRVEGEMDTGSFVDRSEAERTTLAEALKRYRKEIVPEKRHPYQEERRIDRWLDNDLAYRTLAGLRGVDFAKYRDDRRAAGRAENTIRLELQVIRHLFEIARKEWGTEGLPNPLDNIRKPSGSKARDRRLRPDEFDKLKALLSASRTMGCSGLRTRHRDQLTPRCPCKNHQAINNSLGSPKCNNHPPDNLNKNCNANRPSKYRQDSPMISGLPRRKRRHIPMHHSPVNCDRKVLYTEAGNSHTHNPDTRSSPTFI